MRDITPVPPPSRTLNEGNPKYAMIGYWVFVTTFFATIVITAFIVANESGVL